MAMAAPASPGTRAERVGRARRAAELGAAASVVVVERSTPEPRSPVLGLDDRDPGKRAYLVLRNLHTWSQPEVLFHVWVAPADGPTRMDAAHYAGNIHFFDAQFHDHGQQRLDLALGDNFYSFDVTPILERFRRQRITTPNALRVIIAPAGRPSGGEPMVGTIELIRQ